MANRFSTQQKTAGAEHMDYGAAAFWEHREQFHWNTMSWSSSFLLLYQEDKAAPVEHYGE